MSETPPEYPASQGLAGRASKRSELAKLVPATLTKLEQGSQKFGTGIWTKTPLWPPAAQDDLGWWLETAPTLQWKWAKTYAKTAPHWYLQREQTYCTLTLEEYHRALSVIWTFGRLEHFYGTQNAYLYDEPSSHKWWAMGRPDYGVALINMTRASSADPSATTAHSADVSGLGS